MDRRIVWEFESLDHLEKEDKLGDSPTYKDGYGDEHSEFVVQHGPFANTPFGVVNLETSSFFEFWHMHTNFILSEGEIDLIESVDGVEILEQFSRYRLRLSVGKCFEFPLVRRSIEEVLGVSSPKEMTRKLEEEINRILTFKFWGILQLPNGEIEVVTSDENSEDFQEKLSFLRMISDGISGKFLDYKDVPKLVVNKE